MNPLYEQSLADARELAIATKLMMEGYSVSKPLSGASRYDLVVEKGGKFAKIQVKSLRLDSAYENNDGRVYIIDAYSVNPVNKTKNTYSKDEVDIIVGYNHGDNLFAAVPLESLNGKQSCVVHTTEGKTRNEFLNSWKAVEDHFLSLETPPHEEQVIQVLVTLRKIYDDYTDANGVAMREDVELKKTIAEAIESLSERGKLAIQLAGV